MSALVRFVRFILGAPEPAPVRYTTHGLCETCDREVRVDSRGRALPHRKGKKSCLGSGGMADVLRFRMDPHLADKKRAAQQEAVA